MVIINFPETSYFVEPMLHRQIHKNIKPALNKNDEDYVAVVDGNEGVGKSTLAFQIARAVDSDFCLDRIVFSPDTFREVVMNAKKGQAIVFDEAITGFSSRGAMSRINKMLTALMMQMRQKNLFVIIVIPTFFLLDKYVALWRAKVLIHCFKSKGKRGFFRVYNSKKKKWLYLSGKKLYEYNKVRTRLRGRFYGKFALGVELDLVYRKKKEDFLNSTTDKDNEENLGRLEKRYRRGMIILVNLLMNKQKYTQQQICEELTTKGYKLERSSLSQMLVRGGFNGNV